MLKLYRGSEFVRNVVTMMSGTVLSQMLPILLSPIMTRIFSPTDYGIYGLYMAISGILNVLVTSHYNHAIMLPNEEDESVNIIGLCLVITVAVSILLSIMFQLLNKPIAIFFGIQSIAMWLYCVPLSVLLSGCYSALNYWTNKNCKYKRLAVSRMAQTIIMLSVQVVLGLIYKDVAGLLLGLLAGQLVSTLILFAQVWKDDGQKFSSTLGLNKIYSVAVKHKSFAYYLLPADFINAFNNQVPTFLLTKFASAAEVGKYNFTQRILGLPVTFISSSLIDVFKQRAISDYNQLGNCRDIYKKTFITLALLGLLPLLIILFTAPSLFAFVFGERWRDAGVYAQILSVMFYLRLVISPLSYIYYIVGKQREDFILHILMAIGTMVSLYLGYQLFNSPKYMVLLFSINYSIVYLIYLSRSYMFAKGNSKIKVN